MGPQEVFEFGEFTLDVIERRLLRGQVNIPLAPKAHDLLVELLRHAGHLVTKRELLELVWPESFVEEGILAVHIAALRKALGENNRNGRLIETVPRSGYRFVSTVRRWHGPDAEPLSRQTVAVLPTRAAGPAASSGS